jgi:hypothetical protein
MSSSNRMNLVLIDTTSAIRMFMNECGGEISQEDLCEIVEQITVVLLNGDGDQLQYLPDSTRLRNKAYLTHPHRIKVVHGATQRLITELIKKFVELGMLRNGELCYTYYKFIGLDLVLTYIPY